MAHGVFIASKSVKPMGTLC